MTPNVPIRPATHSITRGRLLAAAALTLTVLLATDVRSQDKDHAAQ